MGVAGGRTPGLASDFATDATAIKMALGAVGHLRHATHATHRGWPMYTLPDRLAHAHLMATGMRPLDEGAVAEVCGPRRGAAEPAHSSRQKRPCNAEIRAQRARYCLAFALSASRLR